MAFVTDDPNGGMEKPLAVAGTPGAALAMVRVAIAPVSHRWPLILSLLPLRRPTKHGCLRKTTLSCQRENQSYTSNTLDISSRLSEFALQHLASCRGIAEPCRVLQRLAAACSALLRLAARCSMQRLVVWFGTLQCLAPACGTTHREAISAQFFQNSAGPADYLCLLI